MVSILDHQIKLDMDDSIIDCNWYYGCLFSPKENVEMYAVHDENAGNNGDSKENHHPLDTKGEWLASIFTVLDEDDDGRLTVHEIMRFLQRLGLEMPKEELELAVRSVSACGDEFLTAMEFAEFYRIMFANKEEEADVEVVEEKAICEAFNVFDQNGDGFISAMELADVLSRLGFVEGRDVDCCQSMIKSVDFNGDGFVDIHEFKHLISKSVFPHHTPLQCVAAIN